jgi:tetratricopeptide (TPR) repeat protein
VWLQLLGPVELCDGDRRVACGPAKQRSVLAILAMEAGHVVPTSVLIDRIWDNDPPESAASALYAYVNRLRKALIGTAAAVVRRSGGYLLDIDPDLVDVHRFRRLICAARSTTGALDDALALWRGNPFDGATGRWFVEVRRVLAEERRTAQLDRHEAYLSHGRHTELIAPLREIVAGDGLDERPVAQLMLALYRSGRAGEALAEYQRAHDRLIAQVGQEPGAVLKDLQQRILRDDPTLIRSSVNSSLPPDVPGFVGRAAELSTLDEMAQGRTVVISAVDGTAGVGKTALAVHWAHRHSARFPDGGLYANLSGHGPGSPAEPAQVLDGFLAALGVPAESLPADLDAKAALYRNALRERRMVILLDNAATPRQVRPLLPGASRSAVLVTSRTMLAGLVARDHVRRICLDVLPREDAIALLAEFVGPDRIAVEPAAADDLAALCAYLPVALCVAGERASAQPHRKLRDLVDELADGGRRLDVLDADGDPDTAVRAVFSWSYRSLPAAQARAFRLIGGQPGADIDAYALAALAETDVPEANRLLVQLGNAHLIEHTGTGRYRMHDLLRAYAVELAAPDEARPALTRLLDLYLVTASLAVDILYPADAARRPPVEPGPRQAPSIEDAQAARSWLDTERANITAACRHAATRAWSDHVPRLAVLLYRYLQIGGHTGDATAIFTAAVSVARRAADPQAEAEALVQLGRLQLDLGESEPAEASLRRALGLSEAEGDQRSAARALGNLSYVLERRGQYGEAVACMSRALRLFELIGDRYGQAQALGAVGIVLEYQGRYAEAIRCQQRALAIFREVGDRPGEARTLTNLGCIYQRQRLAAEAAEYLQQALAFFREMGDRPEEATALTNLGVVHRLRGRLAESLDHHRRALALYRQTGVRDGEADALNGLGEALVACGQFAEAIAAHTEALATAHATSLRREVARAQHGLAAAYCGAGQLDQAGRHGETALRHYVELAAPDADHVRQTLAAIGAAARHRGLTCHLLSDVDAVWSRAARPASSRATGTRNGEQET